MRWLFAPLPMLIAGSMESELASLPLAGHQYLARTPRREDERNREVLYSTKL